MFFFIGILMSLWSCNTPPSLKTNKEKNIATTLKVDTMKAKKPISYDSTKTYIYLTFDDGPQGGTKECIEVCKKAGIKATFFMVGNHATSPALKQMVKDIKAAYPIFLLANHSTTHANGRYHYFYNHPQMAAEDFYKAQQTLEVPYKIIRLPGNTSWVTQGKIKSNNLTRPVCKILDSAGYNVIGWDVEWNFSHKNASPKQSAQKMAEIVNKAAYSKDTREKNHIMILTHDRMFKKPNFTDSLATFINLLQQNKNYIFETVDNYPNLKQL